MGQIVIKLSIVLGVVQTALLIVIVVEMTTVRQSLSRVPVALAAPASAARTSQVAQVDEAQLKRIVSEALHQADVPASKPATTDQTTDVQPTSQIDDGSWQKAQGKLAYMKSTGTMSQAQLRDFEATLAGLDPVRRRQMLGALFKAMNAGEVKGFL